MSWMWTRNYLCGWNISSVFCHRHTAGHYQWLHQQSAISTRVWPPTFQISKWLQSLFLLSQRGKNIQVEEEHLRGVLEGNGCPEAFVKMASRPHTAREPAEEPQATAFILYAAGLSKDARRVCRRYNIRTVFQSASTLRGQLTRVKDKDPLEKKSWVVYRIPCRCCHV